MLLWNARLTTLVLLALLVLFQAQLWFGRGSVSHVMDMNAKLTAQLEKNTAARALNESLSAQVQDLQTTGNLVEERARMELGMVKRDEIYVQYAK